MDTNRRTGYFYIQQCQLGIIYGYGFCTGYLSIYMDHHKRSLCFYICQCIGHLLCFTYDCDSRWHSKHMRLSDQRKPRWQLTCGRFRYMDTDRRTWYYYFQ